MTTGEDATALQEVTASTYAKRYRPFSFSRIYAITINTVTELTRRLEFAGFTVTATPMGRGTPFANVLLEARARA